MSHEVRNRTVALALFAALVSGLVACSDESPEKLLASGKSYMASNQRAAARIQLTNALQKRPDYGEARFLLGKVLFDDEQTAAAVKELGRANELRYSPDDVVPLLARALLSSGDPAKVIALDAATRLARPDAVADFKTTVAIAHQMSGDPQHAHADVAAALQARPDWAPALLLQADELAAKRRFDEAGQIVEAVLAKSPDMADALVFKGDLLRQTGGDPERSIALYRQALAAEPGDLPAFSALVDQLLQKNDMEGARREIQSMNGLRPHAVAVPYFRARLAAQQGDLKTAEKLLQPLLGGTQADARFLGLAGWVALKEGKWALAETYLGKVVRGHPRAAAARQLLAQAMLHDGEPAKAIETLDPLLESPAPDARTLSLAAGAHLLAGDADTAEGLFRRAAQLDPASQHDRTGVAVARVLGDDPDKGLGALEGLSAEATTTDADLALISALVTRRDYDRALQVADRLRRKTPDQPESAQLRAQVLALRGDLPAARAAYEQALTIRANFYPAIDGLAALDVRQGHPDAARARFQAVLVAHPDDVRAMVALARLDAMAGALRETVVAWFAKAIALKPADVSLRRELVLYHLRQHDSKAALTAAQDAAAANSDDADALALLAGAQLAAGNVHQAVGSYARVTSLRPQSVKALLGLAQAQFADKDYPAAAATVSRAAALAPDSPEVVRSGVQLDVQAGRQDAAITKARALQARQPKVADGYALEGDVLSARHDWAGAVRAYRAALQREPGSTALTQGLYLALRASGDTAGSASVAARWMADHPQDATFAFFMAAQAIAGQQYDRAEEYLRQGLRLDGDNAMALNNLAWVLSAGRKPQALAYAERANALAPNQPVMMDTLAQVLAQQGQLPRALQVQRKAVEIAPDAHDLRLRLAQLLVQQGDTEAARVQLEALSRLGAAYARQSDVRALLTSLPGGASKKFTGS